MTALLHLIARLGALDEAILILSGAVFLTALASGTLLIALVHRISWRIGVLDKPDGQLKCHQKPTATLGGIALFFSMVIAMTLPALVRYGLNPQGVFEYLSLNISRGALLIAGLIIVTLGATDDIYRVMPRTKLLFQMLASTVLIGSGLVISRCDFFGVFNIYLGALGVPFTLFWLVGSCNAFNFIDGLDGLASGIGLVVSLALAILGLYFGMIGTALLALALAGALLAMLLFNIRPALIFLGDSGSQLIGLMLGVLSIRIASASGSFALPAAGLILSIPIIDAFLSILRRYSSAESPAHGDRHHAHHRLRRLGFGVTQTSMTLWLATAVAGTMGLLSILIPGIWMGLAALAFVGLEIFLGVRLGCVDFSVVSRRLAGTFRWNDVADRETATRKRVAELEVLWDRMKPLFEQMKLDRVILTLEGIGTDGRTNYETYQWVRNDKLIAEILNSRWTKRFSLDGDTSRMATLRLESAAQLRQDEKRIDWLLKQIRSNMRHVAQQRQEAVRELQTLESELEQIGINS